MKKNTLLAYIFFLFGAQLNAQQFWNKSYTFSGQGNCYDMIITSDSGILRTGVTYGTHRNPYLIKLNSNGNVQWSYSYDNGYDCESFYVFETNDKGFIFFGNNYDGNNKLLVTRVDSIGNVLWSNNFFTPHIEYCMIPSKTSDNGYLLTSWYRLKHGSIQQGLIIKIDSSGNYLWSERARSVRDVYPYKTIETLSGAYLFIGSLTDTAGTYYPYIMKLNKNGKAVQSKSFPNIVNGRFNEIFQTQDSCFVLSGDLYSDSGFLMKLDKNLNILSMKEIAGNQLYGFSLVESTNHDIFLNTYDYFAHTFTKIDSLLNPVWTKTTNSLPISISSISNNDFLINTSANGNFGNHGVLKTDLTHLNTCGIHDTTLLFTTFFPTDSSIIVTHFPKVQQVISYVVTKIPLSVTENIECIISDVNEMQSDDAVRIYPNPFSDNITITTKTNQPSVITLYDITSRILLQQTFTNTSTINTSQLAKGIYIYEVRNKSGVIKQGKVVKE